MTEAEWDTCADGRAMLEFLRASGRLTARKARLFAAACCRRHWHLLTDERSRQAVLVAERYADGAATRRELRFAFSCAADAYAYAASGAGDARAAAGAANAAHPEDDYYAAHVTPPEDHPALLRDLFGPLPFRAVQVGSTTLTPAAVALARAIYEERRFEEMPVLADALEEAGCDHPEILDHCCHRRGGHARGCWVLDSVLRLG
jgi:hypothetical protein